MSDTEAAPAPAPAQDGIMSEEELNAYSLPEGPKFECHLPKDHFIQRYMAYGYDVSDAYADYWFAGGLFALANVADKKIKIVLRQGIVYPNLYEIILGKSSLSRKSTAADKTESMLDVVRPYLIEAKVPTEFSPEAFIEHMSNHQHCPWIRDEAAGILSLMKKDYMRGFKDTLMNLYDCRSLHRQLRTGQRKNAQTDFKVDDPYLNVFFATTEASFGANTERNDTLSGFLARFIFFFPRGKKDRWLPLEEGTARNSAFEDVIYKQLSDIATKVSNLPECVALHLSPESNAYWSKWQKDREDYWISINDGSCMQIFSRLSPTIAKLVMLFELGSPDFDPNRPIRLEFMIEACRLVDEYFMQSAKAAYDIVGANAEKNVIDRVIAYLKNHDGKATTGSVMANIKIKKKDLDEYLETMIEAGTIKIENAYSGKAGRPSRYIFLLPSETAIESNFLDKIDKIDKVDKIDIISQIHSDFDEEIKGISAIKSIKSILSTKSTNSTNYIEDNSGSGQKIALKSDRADALLRSNVGEKEPDKNDPLQNNVIIRFKTDYESDWHGAMRKFKEGEIVEIPSIRAETWIKRGIVEEVSELPSDEPANIESFEKIHVAAT